MSTSSALLPQPRKIEFLGSAFALPEKRLIVLDSPEPQTLKTAASVVQSTLRIVAGLEWEIVAGTAVPAEQIGVTISVVSRGVSHPQGYELTVTPTGAHIVASRPAGAFYGALTLANMIVPAERSIPTARVRDWPDFPSRGVMLDVSRDRVPTMETLYRLVDLLAGWKINQLQLYIEHTFAFRDHQEVWAEASPFTGEEILALDAYCRERFIELVPNLNSFGHMHRWLKLPRYAPLAELTGWFDTPWGIRMEGPFGLCAVDPGSIELMRDLYNEYLPHFTSRQFNVGCDETIDLGQGRSKEACEERGTGRVYLNFLLKLYREVKARGRSMQFWGDIITQYPELVPELPRDIVALEWGYEANHPFAEHGALFAASGLPFYVCPGTSSWNTIAGRTDNAVGNLRNAAENGLKHGAAGYLITDWGDRGHWQQPWASAIGFGYGAALSWAYEANRELDVAAAVSRYAFRDPTGIAGRAAYDLGNVYRAVGIEPHNSSALFWILQSTPEEVRASARLADVPPDGMDRAQAAIDAAIAPLAQAQINRPDADLLRREMAHAARLLRHACRRGRWIMGGGADDPSALEREAGELIAEQEALWLARSRPGGLKDSIARMEKMREDYYKAA
jgi:hypothetical protein